jgi:hypothetical protein
MQLNLVQKTLLGLKVSAPRSSLTMHIDEAITA